MMRRLMECIKERTYMKKTRKYWAIAKSRASQIDYVLGVYHGIVRTVLKS